MRLVDLLLVAAAAAGTAILTVVVEHSMGVVFPISVHLAAIAVASLAILRLHRWSDARRNAPRPADHAQP
jgi:hypothetical protein